MTPWTEALSPWEVLRVGPGATRDEVKTAFLKIAKTSHPDKLHASLHGQPPAAKARAVEQGTERFRMAVRAYEMYDMQSGRWAPGLASHVVNAYADKNRRPHTHEPPPFDLRRFGPPRLHPKTRAAVMGLYLSVTLGLAIESWVRARSERAESETEASRKQRRPS